MNLKIQAGSLFCVVAMLALVAGWTPAQVAVAQTPDDAFRFSERSPATGARMMGMAGAGTAGLADYGALFNNPAGLGYFTKSAASGALNSVFTTDESFYRTPGFSSTLDEDVSETNVGNLAYVYRAPTKRGSFVMAVALNQVNSFERDLRFVGTNSTSTISTSFLPFDDEFSLDGSNLDVLSDLPFAAFNGGLIEFFPEFLDDDPNAYPFLEAVAPGTSIEQAGTVLEQGRMNEVSFGGALETARGVMIGLSANLVYGTYEFNSIFEEADVFNENTAAEYSVLLDDGSLLEGFDFLTYQQNLESDLLGVNLRAGISAEISPNIRFGATLESPTFYTVEERFGVRYETVFDSGGSLSYGDRLDDVGNGEFEYEILTPWRLGIGVGFHSDNFTVLADAEFVDWGQLELDADTDRAFFDDLNRSIEENYEAVINGRLGIEYRLGDLMLRGGVAYKPDPLDVPLQQSDGTELDRDKTFFSAGVGYRFNNQFQVDFGWMQARFDSIYSGYPEDDLGPRQDDILLIDEEVIQNQFVVGVSFFF
ncbi:MAG: OmpP1/FadL family transporter [Rhodothermales bacterium]